MTDSAMTEEPEGYDDHLDAIEARLEGWAGA
jgi:hypothetical protein